jgi:hypothetical protein
MNGTINRPRRFAGTSEQARANFATHQWSPEDDAARCAHCDAKPWHAAASYPCGEEPPRELAFVDHTGREVVIDLM